MHTTAEVRTNANEVKYLSELLSQITTARKQYKTIPAKTIAATVCIASSFRVRFDRVERRLNNERSGS
jgi:hypothetical protein